MECKVFDCWMKTVENIEPVDPLLYDRKAQLVMVLVVKPVVIFYLLFTCLQSQKVEILSDKELTSDMEDSCFIH